MTDLIAGAATQLWRIATALCIVVSIDKLRSGVFMSYERVLYRPSMRIRDKAEAWNIKIHLQTAWLFITLCTVIGALSLVLSAKWVEQITSAFVVGQGFALRGIVEDIIWGFVRRSDSEFMKCKHVTVASLYGVVTDMSLTTFMLCTEEGSVHVIPWTKACQYATGNRPKPAESRPTPPEQPSTHDPIPGL